MRALLATLFASRGTLMVCAGDEFGRTQLGNNNAYAQDNEIPWINWESRDLELEEFFSGLAALRRYNHELKSLEFIKDARWRDLDGTAMTAEKWESQELNGFDVSFRNSRNGTVEIQIDRLTRQCVIRANDAIASEAAV